MRDAVFNFDVTATEAVNSLAGHFYLLDVAMKWISFAGVPLLVALVACQWWRRVDRPHLRHVLVAAGLSFLVGLGLNQIILLMVHRPRPYVSGVSHLLIPPSADWSFPSDHATATMAIAAAFLLHSMTRAGLWFFAAAVLMMVSRVYVGTHYVTDVLGGTLTGFAGALVVWKLYQEGTRADRLITGLF